MPSSITFVVNGQTRTVNTAPHRPLLYVLGEDLKLTGTEYGCGEAQCRACTVLVDGKAVASCVTPVSDVDNKKVLTVEVLSLRVNSRPHDRGHRPCLGIRFRGTRPWLISTGECIPDGGKVSA